MKCCCRLVLFVLLCDLWACSNKLDIAGPYEENASVFGLLDPSQPIQYIKINKVFTNPTLSASEIAQIADSLYFDSLTPALLEVETGRVIPLFKTNTLPKSIGTFANYPNYLYSTNEKIYVSNPANPYEFFHYRLKLDLPGGKRHITAITNIPDSTVLLAPMGIAQINKIMDFTSGSLKFAFQAPSNAKIFDGYFFFNFLEVNKLDTTIQAAKFIRIRMFNNVRAYDDNGHESLSSAIDGDFFYTSLLAKIKTDTTVFRRFLPCKFELSCANLEFDNYIQTEEPSIGIVQKQRDYSNVENGVGLFAGRRISRYNNIAIGRFTKEKLTKLVEYKTLGFVN